MPSDASAHSLTVIHDLDRLAALDAYNVLDTPAEQGFDDVVRLATRLCAVPVALVSLVARDRQWFKARIGFPQCETDLDRSVCKFVLSEPDLLVIPDLSADPRTAANPLVTDAPFIRFYAGAPLRTPEGHVLGSLCVIDTVPRPAGLTAEQTDDLRALARQVAGLLEMRRAVERRDEVLDQQRAKLRQARRLDVLAQISAALLNATDPAAVLDPILSMNAGALGFDRTYIYDLWPGARSLRLTHAFNATAEVKDYLHRLPHGEPLCGIVAEQKVPLVLTGLQTSDEVRYQNARGIGLDAYAGYPVMSRGLLRGVISFASTRQPAFDDETLAFFATVARLMSAVYERLDGEKALRDSEAHWRGLFERLSEGFIVGEVIRDEVGAICDWRYLDVNAAWGDLVSIDPATAIGRTIREVFPGIEDAWVSEFSDVVETGQPVTFVRQVGTLARWYEGRAFPLGGERFGVIFLEVTERVQADVRRDGLLEFGLQLRADIDTDAVTRAALAIIGRVLGACRVGYGTIGSDGEGLVVEEDWTASGFPSLAGRHRLDDYGLYAEDLRQGRTVVIPDVREDSRTAATAASLEEIFVRTFINLPITEMGRTVAVLYVNDHTPRTWTKPEVAFVRQITELLRQVVERRRAEDRQDLLNHELSHRLKNMLAMVMSIVHQTLRAVPDREPVEALQKRIQALASAHDLLLRRSWAAADLRAVCGEVLRNMAEVERFTLDGPDVALGPSAALSTSLLCHELATNAAKYGAFSTESGHVEVRWRLESGAAGPDLVLRWRESGGPPVVVPTRRGFGSRLIRTGLVGTGCVEVMYHPEGVEAVMRAPMIEVQRS